MLLNPRSSFESECRNLKINVGDSQPSDKKRESSFDSKTIITVKATVKKSTNRLLFAQTEEGFADFLFSFLTIPLGGVEYLFQGNTSLGNIDDLYRSITKLIDDKYLSTPHTKERLIKPELPPKYLSKNQIFPLADQVALNIYYFENAKVTDAVTVEKGFWMSFKDPKGQASYVKKPGKFVVADDLSVKPLRMVTDNSKMSLSILNKLKIPSSDVKEMELQIGFEEHDKRVNEALKQVRTSRRSEWTNQLPMPPVLPSAGTQQQRFSSP